MSDKCSNEASAIKTVLPWARHLCHWHVYSAMEEKNKSLKIEKAVKQRVTHIHMGLKNTTDARQFKQLEEELESLSPDFFSYYSQQWQPCKDQWASYLRVNVVNFCNDTNNLVE
ncbi:hypothetical protein EGW08_014393, partial [Elysia chlorotica]